MSEMNANDRLRDEQLEQTPNPRLSEAETSRTNPAQSQENPRSINISNPALMESTNFVTTVPLRTSTLDNQNPTNLGEQILNRTTSVCLICKNRQNNLNQTLSNNLPKVQADPKLASSAKSSLTSLKTKFVSSSSSNFPVSTQLHNSKVTKRYRKSRLRLVKRQEYKRLREMVPVLQEKDRVSKIEVIEEAIKYIDELHDALVQRFRTRGLPPLLNDVNLGAADVDGENIRELIRGLLANNNPASLPPSRIENVRTTPSFLQKTNRNRKT